MWEVFKRLLTFSFYICNKNIIKKMEGYQIMVHEDREDPDDWTCQCHIDRDYIYKDKVYLNEDEANAELARLRKEEPVISYNPMDCGYLTYSLRKVTIK